MRCDLNYYNALRGRLGFHTDKSAKVAESGDIV